MQIAQTLGEAGLNLLGTHKAAGSDTLRWTWGESQNLTHDYRFAAGIGGVVANYFGKGDLKGLGEVVAKGAMHSLIATETMRKSAIKRQEELMPQLPAQQPQQMLQPAQPQAMLPAGQQAPLAAFIQPFMQTAF